jgi:hypothetical protein
MVEVIEAEEFRLVDSMGVMRGTFTIQANNEPGFVLFDKKGNQRIGISLNEKGYASIILNDGKGKLRMGFRATESNDYALNFYDKNDKVRISIGIDNLERPIIGISGDDNQERLILSTLKDKKNEEKLFIGFLSDENTIQCGVPILDSNKKLEIRNIEIGSDKPHLTLVTDSDE